VAGRLVSKRAELFGTIELATEIEALKAQLAIVGAPRPPSIDPSSVRDHLTRFPPHAQGRLALGRLRRRLGDTPVVFKLADQNRLTDTVRVRDQSRDRSKPWPLCASRILER